MRVPLIEYSHGPPGPDKRSPRPGDVVRDDRPADLVVGPGILHDFEPGGRTLESGTRNRGFADSSGHGGSVPFAPWVSHVGHDAFIFLVLLVLV